MFDGSITLQRFINLKLLNLVVYKNPWRASSHIIDRSQHNLFPIGCFLACYSFCKVVEG
jgi:hypothetical protein